MKAKGFPPFSGHLGIFRAAPYRKMGPSRPRLTLSPTALEEVDDFPMSMLLNHSVSLSERKRFTERAFCLPLKKPSVSTLSLLEPPLSL